MNSHLRNRAIIAPAITFAMLLLGLFSSVAHAQESKPDSVKPDQAKTADVEAAEAAEKAEAAEAAEAAMKAEEAAIDAATVELFAVPKDASEKELLAYIAKAKRMLPKKRPKPKRLMEIRINSVIEACDLVIASASDFEIEKEMIQNKLGGLGIMRRYFPEAAKARTEAIMKSLEEDSRPEMVSFLKSKKLAEKAIGFSKLAEEERAELLDSIFEEVKSVGLSRDLYIALSREGRGLESKSPESAVDLYTRMAISMEASKSPEMVTRAKSMRGIVRRMSLLGSEMELKGKTVDGEKFDWAAYRGKVVLVDFWASWCGPCLREVPNVKKQLELYGDKGFVVVGVNMDDTKEKCTNCIEQKEITWVNLFSDDPKQVGWNTPMAAYYGVKAIPTAILVGKDGKVVSMQARGKKLDELLQDLLEPVKDESINADDKMDSDSSGATKKEAGEAMKKET